MTVKMGFQDIFENEDISDKIMWNLFEPLDLYEDPRKAEAQLLTLKLVNKKLNKVVCSYMSRINASVSKKYKTYFKNDDFVKSYSICELMILSQFSSEASLHKYLKYPHCYSNLESVGTLSNLFDKVTFRLKIKLDLNRDALAALCKLFTDQKKVDQFFISQLIPLSQTLLHKYSINFFLLSKYQANNFEIVGTSYISEFWTYTLIKLLCKTINSLQQYRSDVEVLMKNDKTFSLHYDFPLTTHEKNPFSRLKNWDLSQNYDLCIQTRNTYLNDTEQTPKLIDFHEVEHVDNREVTLEKLIVICWPSFYQSNQDAAFLTFDMSSTFGIDSELSSNFLEALCNIHSSNDL